MTRAKQSLTPAQWLDLIEQRAQGLREAGVTHIELEGCLVELAPHYPEQPGPAQEQTLKEIDAEIEKQRNALADPETFGGWMPSFPREGDDA